MPSQQTLKLAIIGTLAGIFSGLFGVGGGTVIVFTSSVLFSWFEVASVPTPGTTCTTPA